MTLKQYFVAARRYHALKKCVKHALLTYRYGSVFVASSGGISSLLSLAPKLAEFVKAKSAVREVKRERPAVESDGIRSE